jgi:HEPN domain-containing protein
MNKNNIKNSSEMFLYKATVDLNSAKYLLSGYENENLDIDIEKIYFELQQSAEKLLKSMLSSYGVKFPKSHDIEQLVELCTENNITLADDIEILIELSDYAVEGRYSIIHDDINESNKYIKILENIVKEISENEK